MPDIRIGSMFSGYGGLDAAVERFLGARTVWHAESGVHASSVLAHNFPSIPNHGDVTAVDWSAVEPVEVLTGGFPCQDLSSAGKRAGLVEGTRSGLWLHMARAIDALRPGFVVIENVRGMTSAKARAAGGVELCEECVGAGGGEPELRALGCVLGDLADLGYDAQWCAVRASDAGAPHQRLRIFITAHRPETVSDAPFERRVEAVIERGDVEEAPAAEGQAVVADRDGEPVDGGGVGVGAGLFGPFAPAVEAWSRVVRRPPPHPTEPNPRAGGRVRLSPAFVEWLMGLPAGWVTGVGGISWTQQLAMLGNGVVPQQAMVALEMLHGSGVVGPHNPGPLLPTPNPFHSSNREMPDEWRRRRIDVKARTGTMHGPALPVVARSFLPGERPLLPENYMEVGPA